MITPGDRGEPFLVKPGWIDAFVGRPRRLQAALDATGLGFAVATVASTALLPDVLLHCVWVVLVVEAFAFGLRVTSLRIFVASLFVVLYSAAADESGSAAWLVDLDLAEWPLMVVIAILVAVMADRVTSTSRRYAGLFREASGRLLTAQEDERRRIAQDLHDGVGQTMTALSLTLDAAEATLRSGPEPPPELSRTAIHRAQELTAVAMDEARNLAFRLSPPRLEHIGLFAGLAELASAAGSPVELEIEPALVRSGLLGPASEVEAFRIAQEALANSLRHAHASRRWIGGARVDGEVRLEIGDDGAGFDAREATRRGLGLAGMAERAAAIGGRLAIESAPGRGTVVKLAVAVPPLEAPGEVATIDADSIRSLDSEPPAIEPEPEGAPAPANA